MWSECGVGAQEAESDREEVGCAEPDGAQVPVEDLEPEAGRVLGACIRVHHLVHLHTVSGWRLTVATCLLLILLNLP
jgi:hypothetical protein